MISTSACITGPEGPKTGMMAMVDKGMAVCLAVLVGLGLFACSEDDTGSTPPKGRGTTACQAYQKAFCNYAGVKCPTNITEQECINDYYGIECTSDDAAQSCATAFNAAICGNMPPSCQPIDIANRAPAVAACAAYIDALCNKGESCGGDPYDTCVAEATASLDCSTALSVGLSYETCISEIKNVACTTQVLPTSCMGVIKATQ
jgi:hypothetical protein